jgi:leucyl aminopeptidase
LFVIRIVSGAGVDGTLVLPVHGSGELASSASTDLQATDLQAADQLRAEAVELCRSGDPGRAGSVLAWPRPTRTPARALLAGVGAGDEANWRAAGAAIVRAVPHTEPIEVVLPADIPAEAVRGLAEGVWLAAYRYRDAPGTFRSAEVRLHIPGYDDSHVDPPAAAALDVARVTAQATWLARDLTNAPSSLKNPAWFAQQVVDEAAARPGLTVTVREPAQLAAEGFGGILAVGGGSASGPRLVELTWSPPAHSGPAHSGPAHSGSAGPADVLRHVVLVGKGVTFDTGGISIKPVDAMKLMRKDMGGAAAVIAATLGAADLGLPIRITAVVPLAENAVIRHYDGVTSESTNTDAEGRLLLADALGYAVSTLRPDILVDLATLTGANAVALGKRTGALYSDDDGLADALAGAAAAAGEQVWRMPLPDDYVQHLRSDIADLYSAPAQGAGSVLAALYLREFVGDLVDRWAHIDMSAPSWAEAPDGDLTAGATGWGARTLLRYLGTVSV